jgi:hypothetical protein
MRSDDMSTTSPTTWAPTHRVTHRGATYEVLLVEGVAYTESEWDTCSTADIEVSPNGEWTFQGAPLEGEVEEVSTRVLHWSPVTGCEVWDTAVERAIALTGDQIRDFLEDVRMPAGITAALVAGRNAATNSQVRHLVVSAQVTCVCDSCGQQLPPWTAGDLAIVNESTGDLTEWSRQHGCGQWARVVWETRRLPSDIHDLQVVRSMLDSLVELVRGRLEEEQEALRTEASQRLRGDLVDALDLLVAVAKTPSDQWLHGATLLEEWQHRITAGSGTEPGVWVNGGQIEAWAFDPTVTDPEAEPVVIAITVADLFREVALR